VNPLLEGPVVLVTPSVAARLARPLGDALRRARDSGERVPSDVIATVRAIDEIARAHAARRVEASLTTSASRSSEVDLAEVASYSPGDGWITTREAADRLGCSPRYVTMLIDTRRLGARRVGRAWSIDAGDVERLVREREAASG
jgi:excisionase family DNA binding protein